jgi:hypothetical protein
VTECSECGATGCHAAFDDVLALEFTNPDYFAVHHLTVAAFSVQHPSRLSAQGWRSAVALLRELVVDRATPGEARQRTKPGGPSLTRGERFPLDHVPWSTTIVDVGTTTAGVYCRDIRAWARSVAHEAAMAAGEERSDGNR